jgi:hypothetical protein
MGESTTTLVVSAGAGSGKTHRLAGEVFRAISSRRLSATSAGALPPEGQSQSSTERSVSGGRRFVPSTYSCPTLGKDAVNPFSGQQPPITRSPARSHWCGWRQSPPWSRDRR